MEHAPFFAPTGSAAADSTTDLPAHEQSAILAEADALLAGEALAFGHHRVRIGVPPDWHANPLTGARACDTSHWSEIPDFTATLGDIKTVWELSRCGWAPLLAAAFRLSGEPRYLLTLDEWLDDWQRANPVNAGVNWKCGQECSIRVLHVLQAALLVDGAPGVAIRPRLAGFVADHAARIGATLSYALAQDNNHGTSEAAALFIGGHWLLHADTAHADAARRWARTGRRNLEERLRRLVLDDGTFSQYSSTYHRVLLATLTEVLIWQELLDLPAFTPQFHDRAGRALDWLISLTDPGAGDAPNLGANDGADILRWSRAADYRDFRPAINALAARLGRALPYPALADAARQWLPRLAAAPAGTAPPPHNGRSFTDGGFETLAAPDGQSWALLRTARFRFRPSHADIHHVDFWHQGRNLLIDAGTYSYASPAPGAAHALKTAFAHNTITFDGHDQMPALGRFLYGGWPRGEVERASDGCSVDSRVRHRDGNLHQRRLEVSPGGGWRVIDRLEGPFATALLRWHLADIGWQREGEAGIAARGVRLAVTVRSADGAFEPPRAALHASVVSRYYLSTEPCLVFEIALDHRSSSQPIVVSTTITVEE